MKMDGFLPVVENAFGFEESRAYKFGVVSFNFFAIKDTKLNTGPFFIDVAFREYILGIAMWPIMNDIRIAVGIEYAIPS